MGRMEVGLMSLAALAASSVSALATEQGALRRIPQVTGTREIPLENPMTGAEFTACISRADVFELGVVDNGTLNDGRRILSSIGSYYFDRNIGTIEERLARADQYNASLENCSADDLRMAALSINAWFPDFLLESDPLAPLVVTARSFATEEIRRRLQEAAINERRSGV